MNTIPINEAEAILDPFWDPSLSELKYWTVEPGPAHGLAVQEAWCWVGFEWARRPASGPALRMTRRCDVNCGDYDRLVLSTMAPEGAVVTLACETDRGPRRLVAPPGGPKKRELALDLDGATRLDELPLMDGVQHRLALRRAGTTGCFSVRVELRGGACA